MLSRFPLCSHHNSCDGIKNPFLLRSSVNMTHQLLLSSSILRKGVIPLLKTNVVLQRGHPICMFVVSLTFLYLKQMQM